MEAIEQLQVPPEGEQALAFPKPHAQSFFSQFWWIEWKLQISYWRNSTYNGTRLLFATVIALLMGCILWNIGSKRYALCFLQSALCIARIEDWKGHSRCWRSVLCSLLHDHRSDDASTSTGLG